MAQHEIWECALPGNGGLWELALGGFLAEGRRMNRVAGLETEYGCLVSTGAGHGSAEAWAARVRNYVFKKARLGVLDQHYRDYEEPPGNGGFLLNGGRLYVDMGHLEYASPECLTVRDLVAYDLAGDALVQAALGELGIAEQVSFLKNNIDHHTGATFGCHENYLMRRELEFDAENIGTLLGFLATRQIFTGAGRVGQASPQLLELASEEESAPVDFQISQRADHIVNDIYQWVQFNRAIINARDEPLADYRKYRRLHLLIGDSNMSPFATALKIGTTALMLTLLEEQQLPRDVILEDAVRATREISREGTGRGVVRLADGRTRDALDLQESFLDHTRSCLAGRDEETDWILESWAFTLQALRHQPERLVGGVDWISKKWLLEMFREKEGLSWQDPWLQSLDLEYHNLDPARGLFFALVPEPRIAAFNESVRVPAALHTPPANTRAQGRGQAVAHFNKGAMPYLINWDSIAVEKHRYLLMPDPFKTYAAEVAQFLD